MNSELLEEIRVVEELSSIFVSVSKPSTAIKRLLAKRKRLHEKSCNEMNGALLTISKQYEDELRSCTEELQIEINGLRNEIERIQDKLHKVDLLDLDEMDYESTWEGIGILIDREKLLINQFHDHLREIETKRRDCAKPIIQKYYEILRKASHLLPDQIDEYVEQEMQKYDEAASENYRMYADLYLQLCLLTDTYWLQLKNWVEDLQAKRQKAIHFETIKALELDYEILQNPEMIFMSSDEGKLAMSELNEKKNLMQRTLKQWDVNIPFCEEDINYWSTELNNVAATLGDSVRNLINSYRNKLSSIYNDFCSHAENIKNVETNIGPQQQSITSVDTMIQSVKEVFDGIIFKLQELQERNLHKIDEVVLATINFLYECVSFWAWQESQLSKIKESILISVNNIGIKGEENCKNEESKLKSQIASLRQEHDERRMEKHVNASLDILVTLQRKYKNTFQDQYNAIKKYTKLVENLVPILETKLEQLLKKNPDKDTGCYSDNFDKNSWQEIPLQINNCTNQTPSLINWRFKVANMIQSHHSNFITDILKITCNWENTNVYDCGKILEEKLKENSRQHDEIRKEVYDLRLHEIRNHNTCLKQHKLGIHIELQALTVNLEKFLLQEKSNSTDYMKDLVDLENLINEIQTFAKIKHLQNKINRRFNECEKMLQDSISTYQDSFNSKISYLHDKNNTFLQTIKLFEDGGNFNNEEYKFFQKELISCKKLIDRAAIISTSKLEKTIKGIISELEQKKNKILYHTDGILHVVKFHEEISLTLDRCKISIEQLINKLYDETKEFAVNVINLTETDISYSQQNIPVSPLVNDWLSVLSMSGDRMEDLKIPVPAVRIPINGCYNFKDVRSNGEFQSKSKRQNISKSLTNYMNVLFGSNDLTLDGNHFASIVMNIIWSTFIRIQEKAMSFFSSVKEPKQISDSMYHDLMQKTVLRLHCYLLQTEDVWIKKLAENLRIYEVLKQYTANWILKCVEYFNKMHIVPIMSKKKHMITTVENMIKEGFTRRDKVLESLKVSHGYPGHRNSSETLVGNLRKNEQILCDNIKLTFEQYKDNLRKLCDSYKPTMLLSIEPLRAVVHKLKDLDESLDLYSILNQRLLNVSSKLSMENADENLSSKMYKEFHAVKETSTKHTNNTFTLSQFITLNHKVLNFISNSKFTSLDGNVNKIFIERYQLNMPQRISLSKISKALDRKSSIAVRSFSSSYKTPVMQYNVMKFRKHIINNDIEMDVIIDEYAKTVQKLYDNVVENTEKEISKFMIDWDEFKKHWNQNMEMLLKVYDIKYVCYGDTTQQYIPCTPIKSKETSK